MTVTLLKITKKVNGKPYTLKTLRAYNHAQRQTCQLLFTADAQIESTIATNLSIME